MPGSNPKISVIVPVYNGEKGLATCLDSLLGQSFCDIEVLAVDNGCVDRSAEILATYAAADTRIKVLTLKENQGPSGARNAALDVAVGEYIAFCDCDDQVPPGAYQALWMETRERKADMVSGAYLEYRRKSGEEIRHSCRCKNFHSCVEGGAVWNRLFRRTFLLKYSIRFRPYRYGEDTLFLMQTLRYASVLTDTDQVVYRYMVYEEGTLARTYSFNGLKDYIAVEKETAALDWQIPEQILREYQIGRAGYLRSYWWNITDLPEKEAGFHLLKEYICTISWDTGGAEFEDQFCVSFDEFQRFSFGEYLAVLPVFDVKNVVLRQYEEGRIGFRYIVKCFFTWLHFKLSGKAGDKKCQKSA